MTECKQQLLIRMRCYKKGGKGNSYSNNYSKTQVFFTPTCWLLLCVSQAQQ